MQKWEYLTALVGFSGTDSPWIERILGHELPNAAKLGLTRGLNVLGDDGWELVSIHWPGTATSSSDTNDPTYIFKRPVNAALPAIDAETYAAKWKSLG